MSSNKRDHGSFERIRSSVRRLLRRFPDRLHRAAFLFINSFITIAILAAVAMLTRTPFVFPSLGPTAFLLFYAPEIPAASPRHTIFGHAIGIICGFGALWVCGLTNAMPTIEIGVSRARTFAAALSLAATGAMMIALKSEHAPAGATTLIISLGFVTKPFNLLVIEMAVALLVLQAIVINRLVGLHYPVWRMRHDGDQE